MSLRNSVLQLLISEVAKMHESLPNFNQSSFELHK